MNRASDLIRSFKQVAVDQTSEEARKINLLDYVDEVLESLRPQLKSTKHNILVEGTHDIVMDTHPGALSQIITNLIMNSIIHAYDEGDEGCIRIQVSKNGPSISIDYSDDGKGMSKEVSDKIFEPFFTTNRGSGGSGLGMHILYNQVTQTLGGSINLESTPGEGTAFRITIPYEFH
ncbi:MAG: HAMP domain-containing histidine kinase [Rhodospirillales bacterium]|nr:HAMP domain-containing histidine kinase [Rhodospirillales bacterium]MBT5351112.1 HAMP domain-containing histidine kinase [Rhodospirillales bacterium]MBT5521612.1 HAMP domain-containing histidine kinase [Rhodospirillales bacterium]